MELTLPQTQLHPKYLPFPSLKSSRVSVFHTITPVPTSPLFQASIFSLNPRNPRNISTAALVDGNGNSTSSTFPIDSGFSCYEGDLISFTGILDFVMEFEYLIDCFQVLELERWKGSPRKLMYQSKLTWMELGLLITVLEFPFLIICLMLVFSTQLMLCFCYFLSIKH